ncbi:MAG TPA: glycosyl hydrolase family 17 protein [Verrucomicrobiae bacterium]|nr:glycosyl hydrolase family 17 protein [Verrucomicrobiae bacterium]
MKTIPLLFALIALGNINVSGQLSVSNVANGSIQISIPSNTNAEYFLERSTDLKEWERMGGILPGTGSAITWKDSSTNSFSFYRASISPLVNAPLYGIDFSPYLDGQSPETNFAVSRSQIESRMHPLIPRTGWIRTFSMVDGLQVSGQVAHQFGLKAALGAWLGPETTPAGISANQINISNLITAGLAGEADLLIVGSEVLQRGDLPVSNLVAYINQVRAAVPGVPVATADTYSSWMSSFNSELLDASDVLLVNFYPFWQGIAVEDGASTVYQQYINMVWYAGSKPVWISETGWPSAGQAVGDAVPSPQNAAKYFSDVVTWARFYGVPFFYFEGYDEGWKSDEGAVGPNWGIWQSDGTLKPGMEPTFDNRISSTNWNAPIDGAGIPSLSFSNVPAVGDMTNLYVSGTASHVSPFSVFLCLYIQVNGSWYQKPYYTAPYTAINPQGTWQCEYATGGQDIYATNFTAFLFPTNYSPPFVFGQPLPAELSSNAIASATASRL